MSEEKPLLTERSDCFPWLLSEWAGLLARAIEAFGVPLAVEIAEAPDEFPEIDWFWWGQQLSLISGYSLWVGAPHRLWRQIGAEALQAAGVEAPEPEDIQDTYREILIQSLFGLATGLTARYHEEVTCGEGAFGAVPPDAGEVGCLSVRSGSGEPALLCFTASAGLIENISQRFRAEPEPAAAPEPSARENPPARGLPVELILDLQMPISIPLGTCRLNLQETCSLTAGSVLPLSRAANELADLRVNGRVVGRGEIVAVNGHYGLRVRDILSRGERLRQLRSPDSKLANKPAAPIS
jgi:flagellar motor switch protein FliN